MQLSNRELYVVYFLGFALGCVVVAMLFARRGQFAQPDVDVSEEQKDIAKLVRFLDLRAEPLSPEEVVYFEKLPPDVSGFPRIRAELISELHQETLLVEQWLNEDNRVRKTRIWRGDRLQLRLNDTAQEDAEARQRLEAYFAEVNADPLGFHTVRLKTGGWAAWTEAEQWLSVNMPSLQAALRVPVDGKTTIGYQILRAPLLFGVGLESGIP
ncbi:MAG: hypothetical protein ACFBZ8_11775 [Opitutales bacterium]